MLGPNCSTTFPKEGGRSASEMAPPAMELLCMSGGNGINDCISCIAKDTFTKVAEFDRPSANESILVTASASEKPGNNSVMGSGVEAESSGVGSGYSGVKVDSKNSTYGSNAIKIAGMELSFPIGKKPFPSQIAVINRALNAFIKKENALVESPTGTGKTLALLVSALAWIRKEKEAREVEMRAANERELANIGLVIPAVKGTKEKGKNPKKKQVFYCSRTHSQLQQVLDELRSLEEFHEGVKSCVLSSRSHTCINEKVKAKSAPRGGSGPGGKGNGQSVDDNCRAAVKENSCFFVNHGRLGEAMNKGGSDLGVWDIEDIVTFGRKHRTCPYYLSRELLETADIVLVPYNFVLDEGIQEASKIDLSDSVVIFDEAHNIEQVARSCSSISLNTLSINLACMELIKLSENGSNSFKVLHDLMNNLLNWIYSRGASINFGSRFGGGESSCDILDGEEMLRIFSGVLQLNRDSIDIYEHHFDTIARESDSVGEILRETRGSDFDDSMGNVDVPGNPDENGENAEELSNASKMMIRSFLKVMKMMIQAKYCVASDFKMAIQNADSSSSQWGNSGKGRSSDEKIFNIWCMNAGAAFNRLNDVCRSIVLASGTLSPLASFSSELGIEFPLSLEAPHVIDVPSQVFSGAVASINRIPLLFTYQNKDNVDLYDNLGSILLSITRITPGGVLLFFPSYTLLDKVLNRWKDGSDVYRELVNLCDNETNNSMDNVPKAKPSWGEKKGFIHINNGGSNASGSSSVSSSRGVFIEPRDSKAIDGFLEEYYRHLDRPGSKAVMFAVCRGKVSEGVNFAHEYARTVLVIGIPYPNAVDPQVKLKREYQDKLKRDSESRSRGSETLDSAGGVSHDNDNNNYNNNNSNSNNNSSSNSSSNHLSGSQWYSLQAFRAVNQCLGRCIRNKDDFGAVLLLDVRLADAVTSFRKRDGSGTAGGFDDRNIVGMLSKWVRSRIHRFDEFDADILVQMKLFFQENVKSRRSKIIYNSYYGGMSGFLQPTVSRDNVISAEDGVAPKAEALNGSSEASLSTDNSKSDTLSRTAIEVSKSKNASKGVANKSKLASGNDIKSLSQTAIGKAFKKSTLKAPEKIDSDSDLLAPVHGSAGLSCLPNSDRSALGSQIGSSRAVKLPLAFGSKSVNKNGQQHVSENSHNSLRGSGTKPPPSSSTLSVEDSSIALGDKRSTRGGAFEIPDSIRKKLKERYGIQPDQEGSDEDDSDFA